MKNSNLIGMSVVAALVAGCAAMGDGRDETRAKALAMMKASFKERGQAKMDRFEQDDLQKA